MKYLDQSPPQQSGNANADISQMLSFLEAVKEQINYMVSTINKEKQNGN